MTDDPDDETAVPRLAGGERLGACPRRAPRCAEDITLRMAVPDWPPTRIMKDMFDKHYKAPSGNTVKLDIDFIPVAGLLHPPQRLAHLGRAEVQHGGVRLASGSAPSSRAATTARSTT